MKLKELLLTNLILLIISLIFVLCSIWLPWYFINFDIDDVEGEEINGIMQIEDKLGERDEYYEQEIMGETRSETITKDNNELKHEYPDTVNTKNVTQIFIVLQIIFIFIAIILIGLLLFKPYIKFNIPVIIISIIFLMSLLSVLYFTFFYSPFEGDPDSGDSDMKVETSESGSWFSGKAKFSGDIVAEGERGVAIGYVFSFINIIIIIIALRLSIKSNKLYKKLDQNERYLVYSRKDQYYPPQQPPPRSYYPPQQPPPSQPYYPPQQPSQQPYYPPPIPPNQYYNPPPPQTQHPAQYPLRRQPPVY